MWASKSVTAARATLLRSLDVWLGSPRPSSAAPFNSSQHSDSLRRITREGPKDVRQFHPYETKRDSNEIPNNVRGLQARATVVGGFERTQKQNCTATRASLRQRPE